MGEYGQLQGLQHALNHHLSRNRPGPWCPFPAQPASSTPGSPLHRSRKPNHATPQTHKSLQQDAAYLHVSPCRSQVQRRAAHHAHGRLQLGGGAGGAREHVRAVLQQDLKRSRTGSKSREHVYPHAQSLCSRLGGKGRGKGASRSGPLLRMGLCSFHSNTGEGVRHAHAFTRTVSRDPDRLVPLPRCPSGYPCWLLPVFAALLLPLRPATPTHLHAAALPPPHGVVQGGAPGGVARVNVAAEGSCRTGARAL